MKNWIKTRASLTEVNLRWPCNKKGQNAIVFNILYDIIPNAWQSPVFQSKLKTKQKERLREVHLRRIIILTNYNICKDSNEPIITRNKVAGTKGMKARTGNSQSFFFTFDWLIVWREIFQPISTVVVHQFEIVRTFTRATIRAILSITRMITDWIALHSVVSPLLIPYLIDNIIAEFWNSITDWNGYCHNTRQHLTESPYKVL